jgi:DNA-binding LacI/PurR family transcriptional regulator
MGSSLLPHVHMIDADFANAGREMGLHLIQQGHRRIGFIHALYLGARGGLGQADGRLVGLRHALAESGIPWDEQKYLVECETTMLDGYQAALRLLRQEPRPTAIFAINDFLALGALQAAAELGLRVPQDLSVAGFDNVTIAQPFGLTTSDPRLEEVAQAAISMIVDAGGRRQPAPRPQSRCFTPRLVIRKTTGPAQARP